MAIAMGQCIECGHRQPGKKNDARVKPLADAGCAKCENEDFAVVEE